MMLTEITSFIEQQRLPKKPTSVHEMVASGGGSLVQCFLTSFLLYHMIQAFS